MRAKELQNINSKREKMFQFLFISNIKKITREKKSRERKVLEFLIFIFSILMFVCVCVFFLCLIIKTKI
jgi:hypothetical protein